MEMEPGLLIDAAVVFTNLLLVVVTALAVWGTLREGHRHEEKIVTTTEQAADADNARMARIVHEVLMQEHEMEAATKPQPSTAAPEGATE